MIPEFLYQRLRGLVADRAWPNDFPQGRDLTPGAIRYTIISTEPFASLCGTDDENTDDVRVQIDVVAGNYPAMRALKGLVMSALETTDPPGVRQAGGFETVDFETKTHRAVLDYLFQQSST